MPEGRVINNAGSLVQEFIITDQQGNARLSFQNNGFGMPVVKQENSYYAFGLIMPNSPVAMPAVPNKRLYNGDSEWQNDYSNLPDYYQTFNRNYDAAIARFVAVDPEAESAESMTSYQYAGNNPIMMNDPMGNVGGKLPLGYNPSYGHHRGRGDDYDDDDQDNDEGLYGTDPELAWSIGNSVGQNIYTANDPFSPLNFTQMVGYLNNQGLSLSWTSADTQNVLAEARGQNIWFSGTGALISTNPLSSGDEDAISAHQLGNSNNVQSVLTEDQLVGLLLSQPVAVPDANQGGDAESLWSQLWNSPVARYFIPDDIGLHFSATLVPSVGGRYSFNIDLLTRGGDAGFHLSQSLSARAGSEGGLSVDIIQGWYNGQGQDATYSSLTGWGADINGEVGPVNAGVWGSYSNGHVSWLGTSAGTGWGVGTSAGVGYTWPIK